MRILLTGGSGDLGQVLSTELDSRGDIPLRLDVRTPMDDRGLYVEGSILDRPLLKQSMEGIDCVVHIAAWHGIHEFRQEKDVYNFWDLNVTGTFYVLQAAVETGIQKIVHISSESVQDWSGIYGHTKVLGEEMVRAYAKRHGVEIITLRPRAFIPYWNKTVYQSFVEWAKWFWSGAVHINDVSQAVIQSIDLLARQSISAPLTLNVDGAYEYTAEDLSTWDINGASTTFKKHYGEYYDMAVNYGLDPAEKPTILDITETRQWLGYEPRYSLRNLLMELEQFGAEGPPMPTF
ncbi:MAG: NAD(P)-dependent oxidoreductase [Chloroflexi bacterium]|nr:NAD(P)-dependent oxidoreductase [Chloroflexota bacterium]